MRSIEDTAVSRKYWFRTIAKGPAALGFYMDVGESANYGKSLSIVPPPSKSIPDYKEDDPQLESFTIRGGTATIFVN